MGNSQNLLTSLFACLLLTCQEIRSETRGNQRGGFATTVLTRYKSLHLEYKYLSEFCHCWCNDFLQTAAHCVAMKNITLNVCVKNLPKNNAGSVSKPMNSLALAQNWELQAKRLRIQPLAAIQCFLAFPHLHHWRAFSTIL